MEKYQKMEDKALEKFTIKEKARNTEHEKRQKEKKDDFNKGVRDRDQRRHPNATLYYGNAE